MHCEIPDLETDMKTFRLLAAGFLVLALADLASMAAPATATLYSNDFEKIDVGQLPDDFLVLDGAFAVQQENGNKFLELPGEPLDTFGVLFGPAAKSDISVSARVYGTGHGRRYPTFGLGLSGQAGYRLQVSPSKGLLELYFKNAVIASVPYDWKSGQWLFLQLQIIKAGEVWKIRGKVWAQGETEPAQPSISYDDKQEPPSGRASLWGSPFAGTPIRYDDLAIVRLPDGLGLH